MRRRVLPALVALCAVLPYLNSLSADYTFDDLIIVRDNPVVHDRPVGEILTWVKDGLYRPVTMLTYSANARLGQDAFGFHLLNVALHALTSVAVFFLAEALLASDVAAVVTAVVFAVHPIHTEAVASIVGRAEILAALFGLVAILAAVRSGTGAHSRLWDGISLASFAAALLSKESGLTVLPLVGIGRLWVDPRLRARQCMIQLLPYVGVALAYLALRVVVVGSVALPTPPHFMDNPLAYSTWYSRTATATVILWQYLSQLALPLGLSADYSFAQIPPVASPLDARFLLAVAVFAALLAALALRARRAPALVIAACFAAIPLVLTANILFPIGTIKAERLLYLPSVGWCLACGWGASRLAGKHWWVTALGVGLIVAVFGGRTWARNRDWQDNLSLFTATVATSPGSAKAHHNLAVALKRRGRWDEAMVHFRRALAIFPDYASAAAGIGDVYLAKGIDAGALHWYETAVALDWDMAKVHSNAAQIHLRLGELDSAEAAIRAALESEPGDPSLLASLAEVRFAEGDVWGARQMVSQAIELASGDTDEMVLVRAVGSLIDRAGHR